MEWRGRRKAVKKDKPQFSRFPTYSAQSIAADFWRFHIPSKMPKADSFPNLDPKETFSDRYDSYEALRLNDGPTGQSGNLNLALLTCWGAST